MVLPLRVSTNSFNPRTREGATRDNDEDMDTDAVSIHAPVRVRHPIFLLPMK